MSDCVNCGNMLPVGYDNEWDLCQECLEVMTDYWRLDVGDNDDEDGFPVWFDGRWVNSKEIEGIKEDEQR